MWRLLSPAQAAEGELDAPLFSFAIAVTHRLNGVPFWPGTCFFDSLRQYQPFAFPFGAPEAPVGPVAPVAP